MSRAIALALCALVLSALHYGVWAYAELTIAFSDGSKQEEKSSSTQMNLFTKGPFPLSDYLTNFALLTNKELSPRFGSLQAYQVLGNYQKQEKRKISLDHKCFGKNDSLKSLK